MDYDALASASTFYTYVGNDPVNMTDPTGMFLWPWEQPVTVVGGTSQERARYAHVVQTVLSTPRGQQLKANIEGPWYWHGSPEEIKLQPGIRYGTGAVFLRDTSTGQHWPTGEIDIDPNFHPLIATTKGAIPATDERVVDTNGVQLAEEEEEPREELSDPTAEIREEAFRNSYNRLRALDPNNRSLTYVTGPNWVPSWNDVNDMEAEVARYDRVTFQTSHAERHLEGTGLNVNEVESTIRSDIVQATRNSSETGSFYGRVNVQGQTIEYRAYTLPNGTINVGTYYPPH